MSNEPKADLAGVDELVGRLRSLKWKINCEVRGMIDDTTAYEAADTIQSLAAQLAEIQTVLSDQQAVHVNMLRGGIAKPSHANIWHLYGRELADAMPDEYRTAQLAEARTALIATGGAAATHLKRAMELEAQLAEARAENERLRNLLKPQWFYYGDDQSSDQCRFSPYEVIDEDFFGWGERKKEGPHLVHISTAMPGPDIWAVVRVLTEEEKDARDDDEPWLIEEYDTEEDARAALKRSQQ